VRDARQDQHAGREQDPARPHHVPMQPHPAPQDRVCAAVWIACASPEFWSLLALRVPLSCLLSSHRGILPGRCTPVSALFGPTSFAKIEVPCGRRHAPGNRGSADCTAGISGRSPVPLTLLDGTRESGFLHTLLLLPPVCPPPASHQCGCASLIRDSTHGLTYSVCLLFVVCLLQHQVQGVPDLRFRLPHCRLPRG
jgi:hypothetical protein